MEKKTMTYNSTFTRTVNVQVIRQERQQQIIQPQPQSIQPQPQSPPPTSQEFDDPWRQMKWDQKKDLEDKLRNFKVKNPDVQQVRILLVGPVGAGKSSFINSVNNAFQGRITCEALVATAAEKSFTKKYQTHYIEGEDGNPLAFVFSDIMGLEAEHGCGAHEQDLIQALEGCVEEGYKFNPASHLSTKDHDYRSNPELSDQIFCLVNVLPADKVSLMDSKIFDKIKLIQNRATELVYDPDLPQVIIMTKPDEACPLVKKNIRKIYTSKKIKEKMQECSNLLGVPMNYIFPVKNYHEEMDTYDDMDAVILKALYQIVNNANDALKKKKQAPKSLLSRE